MVIFSNLKIEEMKIINRLLILLLTFSVLITGCDFFEDVEQDKPYNFSIDYREEATQVKAERDNAISIDIKSDKGISKVEIRKNFSTLSNSEIAYSGEKSVNYIFNIIPPKSEIGQNIEYSIVAFDIDGNATNKELVLAVKKAASLVKVLLPPTAPASINYKDTVSFKAVSYTHLTLPTNREV